MKSLANYDKMTESFFKLNLINLLLLLAVSNSIFSKESEDKHQYNDSITARQLSDLAWKLKDSDPDSSFHLASSALKIARNQNLQQIEAYSLSDIGNYYKRLEDYNQARIFLRQSLKLRKALRDTSDIISGYNLLGLLFNQWEKYDSAETQFEKALELLKQYPNTQLKGKVSDGLAMSFLNMGKYNQSLELLNSYIRMAEEIKDSMALAKSWQNIGVVYQRLGRVEQALRYFLLSEPIYEKRKHINGQTDILINIGVIYLDQGNLGTAKDYFLDSEGLSLKHNFLDNLPAIYNNLGLVFKGEAKFDQARVYFEKGLAYTNKTNRERKYVEIGLDYDGGIKSRREREFLGFTRIMTTNPGNLPSLACPEGSKILEYLSEVKEYFRPNRNDPDYRKRFIYTKGLVQDVFVLKNKIETTVTRVDEIETCDETYEIDLIKHTKTTYDFRKVDIDPKSGKFNQVELDGNGEWVRVSWANISEAESVFPAVISTETIDIPSLDQADKYNAVKYDLKYDQYTNVTEYANAGVSTFGAITSVPTDTIIHSRYIYHNQQLNLSDLLSGTGPFSSLSTIVDPQTGATCYIVTYSDYSNDTICAPNYLVNDPCSLNPTAGLSEFIKSRHRKLETSTIYIYEDSYNTNYSGYIVAQMDYFSPSQAASRTNELKEHRIYLGTVDAAGLTRKTESVLLTSKLAPHIIKNYIDATTWAETELTYTSSGYGNISSIKGPANHAAQRMVVDYTYDGVMEKHITEVDNTSYGLKSCFKYDLSTGILEKTVSPNGHPTQYVDDDFYRLTEIWAARELADANAPATIQYQYYPKGKNPSGLHTEKVPVAFTHHNVNDGGVYQHSNPTTVDCSSLITLTGRPAMADTLQTATFMDGLGRVIQVKKDVSDWDGTSPWVNDKVREVSGFSEYDAAGRVESISQSINEASSIPLGRLNINKSALEVNQQKYDYRHRVIEQTLPHESGTSSTSGTHITTTFGWNTAIEGNWNFFSQAEVNGNQRTKTFVNSFGQKVGTLRNSCVTPSEKIKTIYNYDALNQLKKTTDPDGIITEYRYDDLGRMTKEIHTDRGTTDYVYDKSSNVTQMSNSVYGNIDYTYDFARLKTKTTPTTPEVSDVEYFYGTLSDNVNGAGRVVKVVQGTDYKTEEFRYDELGNVIEEKKKIKVPQAGQRTFTTLFEYDSWGRIHDMMYPDGDSVKYEYTVSGELDHIVSEDPTAGTQVIVKNIVYDGYGNIGAIEYGNGAKTTYEYNTITRRLTGVELNSNSKELLDKTYGYDRYGNVTSVVNSPTNSPGLSIGGPYAMYYEYDQFNRLKAVPSTGSISNFKNSDQEYNLNMVYRSNGRIDQKVQNHLDNLGNPIAGTSYDYDYVYKNSDNSNQLDYIEDGNSVKTYYEYNTAGSATGVYTKPSQTKIYSEKFQWTEEQSLMAVENGGGIHHYVYDHNGQRIMKSSLTQQLVSIDGQSPPIATLVADPYTVYANPYFIATHYTETVEASKHYYMGSLRVASSLIGYPFAFESEGVGEGAGGLGESIPNTENYGPSVNLADVLTAFGKTEGTDYEDHIVFGTQSIDEYDDTDGTETVMTN